MGGVASEEMKLAQKKREETRKRRERRKRSKQLQNQKISTVPLPDSTPHHVDSAPIVDHLVDYDAYFAAWLQSVLVVRPASARNEYIEQHAGVLLLSLVGEHLVESMDPEKDFYLVPCVLNPGEPEYYKRLVVNNMCTRKGNYDATWSRDLVSDQQYVNFYSKLEECIKDQVPSWKDLRDSCFNDAKLEDLTTKRHAYEAEAFCIAKQTEFSNLRRSDIYNCIKDLIQENSLVKDCLHFSREFHLCLLECGYGEEEEISNKYLDWGIGVRHPLCEDYEMQDFTEWLNQPGICEMKKEEKIIELMKYHEKKSKEDCSTRIRYLKLKLELAKRLGLIPEEADTN